MDHRKIGKCKSRLNLDNIYINQNNYWNKDKIDIQTNLPRAICAAIECCCIFVVVPNIWLGASTFGTLRSILGSAWEVSWFENCDIWGANWCDIWFENCGSIWFENCVGILWSENCGEIWFENCGDIWFGEILCVICVIGLAIELGSANDICGLNWGGTCGESFKENGGCTCEEIDCGRKLLGGGERVGSKAAFE